MNQQARKQHHNHKPGFQFAWRGHIKYLPVQTETTEQKHMLVNTL